MNRNSQLYIYDLTCEYRDCPIGIDEETPRFCWKTSELSSQRGNIQSAYRIIVSDEKAAIDKGIGNCFDSQKVISRNSLLTEYGGNQLVSHTKYYWKVKVWDGLGRESNWSDTKWFVTGIFGAWGGKWIAVANTSTINQRMDQVWFAKETIVEKALNSAYLYIASFGFHELYINGNKVGNHVMAPVRSRIKNWKKVLYIGYDITKYLREGKNEIVIWGDAGWTRYEENVDFAVQCFGILSYIDTEVRIYSDDSWLCKKSGNEYLGKFEWGDFGGEIISARAEKMIKTEGILRGTKWETVGLKDICTECKNQQVDGDMIIEELEPISITISEHDKILIDMGKNYTGWVAIQLVHEEESDAIITISDKKEEKIAFQQRNRFIFDEEKKGEFCNRFNFSAGRYITVFSEKPGLKVCSVKGYAVSTIGQKIIKMKSSDLNLNSIFETDLWNYITNTINGVTVDCPHRERLGYGETGGATTWGCGIHNFNVGDYYTSYLDMWLDSQEEGYFPHVAPNFSGGGGTAWSSYPVFGCYDFYMYYKDKRLLKKAYPKLKKWVLFLESNMENGLLIRYEHDEWGFLGDWATPEGNDWGGSKEALFFNNCILALVYLRMCEIAKVLEKDSDEAGYVKSHENLKTNINNTCLLNSKVPFIWNNQRYLAISLYSEVIPEEQTKKYENRLVELVEEKGYLDGGSAGLQFILRYLGEIAKKNDGIYKWLSKTTYPGYGYFLRRGETTWPEMWDVRAEYGSSRIHTCYSGIAGWIVRFVAGIQEAKIHEKNKIILKPDFSLGLKWMKCENESLYGKIVSNWTIYKDKIYWDIEIPYNIIGEIFIPCHQVDKIKSNNRILDIDEFQDVEMKENFTKVQLVAGKYNFVFPNQS